jgi:hypothetical protein
MPVGAIALLWDRGVETVFCTRHRTTATPGLAASRTARHIQRIQQLLRPIKILDERNK